MMALVYLAHILGFVLWLGGGLATMVIGIRSRSVDRAHLDSLYGILRAIQANLMLPGILLTLLSGIYLSMPRMLAGVPTAWLMLMQLSGILAALIFFFVIRPASNRVGTLSAAGETASRFDALRKRAAMGGMIAGLLGLLALIGGVMHKYGG
jgi:uncharacterized membrane protein